MRPSSSSESRVGRRGRLLFFLAASAGALAVGGSDTPPSESRRLRPVFVPSYGSERGSLDPGVSLEYYTSSPLLDPDTTRAAAAVRAERASSSENVPLAWRNDVLDLTA